MNKPQILIVEDDNAVANLISATLETQDYAYKRAATGAGAVMEALSCKPDVVLLDLGLPDMDGVEIIKKIRSWSNMPIIVVSARSEDFDKVSALDAGADDYLTKPFSVEELLARLRTTQRRLSLMTAEMFTASSVFVNGKLKVDYAGGCAYLGEDELHLTPIEYNILKLLLSHPGQVFSSAQIYEQVWNDPAYGSENTVAVHIRHLREKIEIDPAHPRYLKVVWGLGYKMEKV